MSVLTLDLYPDQLKAILKQTIVANPTLVKEILDEIKEETSSDQQFDQAVDDIFSRYDEVFRALA